MSDKQDVTVNVDEHRIGRAAGDAVADQIDDLKREIRETNSAVDQLSDEVKQLKHQIRDVEHKKATAERQAIEDLKDQLREEVERKRQEYEDRVKEVLDDYRGSIKRLKNRFLNSIGGHGDTFKTVNDEFDHIREARSTVASQSSNLANTTNETYRDRIDAILSARNNYFEQIDQFLDDRSATADTIASLQTDLPTMSDTAQITVPFWVVGIETDDGEELRVYSILGRSDDVESPTRSQPYRDYLREHPVHGYSKMADAVRSYVAQDEVRDALASRDDSAYVDPQFLIEEDIALDRFVEALRTYEIEAEGNHKQRTTDATTTEDTAEVTARA